MVILTDELAQIKQPVANTVRETAVRAESRIVWDIMRRLPVERVVRDKPAQPRIVPSALFLTPTEQTPSPDHTSDLSPQQRLIRVRPGDSLWKLANDHATTINELKRVNGLTTDVVQVGQRLILPSSGGPGDRQCSLASSCNDSVN